VFCCSINTLVNQIAARVAIAGPQQWVEAINDLEKHLTLLDGVKHEVKPIHDAVKG
jgi:hypothetical protein